MNLRAARIGDEQFIMNSAYQETFSRFEIEIRRASYQDVDELIDISRECYKDFLVCLERLPKDGGSSITAYSGRWSCLQ